jgi:hypothetical protein
VRRTLLPKKTVSMLNMLLCCAQYCSAGEIRSKARSGDGMGREGYWKTGVTGSSITQRILIKLNPNSSDRVGGGSAVPRSELARSHTVEGGNDNITKIDVILEVLWVVYCPFSSFSSLPLPSLTCYTLP